MELASFSVVVSHHPPGKNDRAILIGRICTALATPAIPRALFEVAAAIPAQAVPCASHGLGVGSSSGRSGAKSCPPSMRAAPKSGWLRWTPSSRIASVTLAEPSSISQPSGASMSLSAPPDSRFTCSQNLGSSVQWSGSMESVKLGSAKTTPNSSCNRVQVSNSSKGALPANENT